MSKYLRYFHLYIVISLLFCSSLSFGQAFRGTIFDKQKNEVLPYANIGVRGKSVGGIADANGNFNIDLSKADLNDTVVVSYLGFRSQLFLKSEISAQKYTVKLDPVPYQLQEVMAIGKREIIIIGNKNPSSNYTGWGDYISSKGRVRGLAIEPAEVPLQLSKFRMRLHHQEFDSVRIRLHILPLGENYEAAHSLELLKENLFITCTKDQKWVEVDLKPYQIVVSGGIIVAAEWVDAWFGAKTLTGDSKRFTISTSRVSGYAYERKTPEEPFSVAKMSYTPTIYLETFRVGKQQ